MQPISFTINLRYVCTSQHLRRLISAQRIPTRRVSDGPLHLLYLAEKSPPRGEGDLNSKIDVPFQSGSRQNQKEDAKHLDPKWKLADLADFDGSKVNVFMASKRELL